MAGLHEIRELATPLMSASQPAGGTHQQDPYWVQNIYGNYGTENLGRSRVSSINSARGLGLRI